MFNRIKYWLLKKLVNDISNKLINRRGYVYLADMRACAEIDWLALYAWELRAEDKEKDEKLKDIH